MKTERLFYENVYLKEFNGKVLSCKEQDGTFLIVLDRTAFYPEGGGQPAEGGWLGDCRVLDVKEEGEEIIHITDKPLEIGAEVTGKINWERRFQLMQQHSGEHIVSGIIHTMFGYDNVGFHMGSEFITIDLNGMIREDEMALIEKKANEYIWGNHEVHIFCPTEEERNDLPYRSKKELTGEVRLVEFPGADLCACCGTHVSHTGEIGLVKLISVKKFRDGVRMEMLCGKDAFDYLNTNFQQNSQIAVSLSVKVDGTVDAVNRQTKEILELKNELHLLKQAGFKKTAQACQNKGDILLLEDHLDGGDIRRLADSILDTCGGICALFAGSDDTDYKFALGQREGDVRSLLNEMKAELGCRGGGKPFFVQGSVKCTKSAIKAFFEKKNFLLI